MNTIPEQDNHTSHETEISKKDTLLYLFGLILSIIMSYLLLVSLTFACFRSTALQIHGITTPPTTLQTAILYITTVFALITSPYLLPKKASGLILLASYTMIFVIESAIIGLTTGLLATYL